MKYLFTYILAIISSTKMKIKQVNQSSEHIQKLLVTLITMKMMFFLSAICMVLFFVLYTSQIKNNVMKQMINCIIHIKHHRNG